ncbi:MAG: recombinase family protein [Candidatus Thiodiazotropha lotti]|nr:recombinase family protein [Candidatus Thiodiazotropha lotti]
MRACLYSRYSSDLQSASSIEDQVRLCEERARHEGWEIVNAYSDAGVSGASLMRPGIQMLLSDALSGTFDLVVTEALDRLSRDQADIAGLFKRLEFAGVKIVTLSEGEITSLHIGLKGTMNEMFLRDLADKTRRGLRGRVENGKSGGGISYGYRVRKMFNALGEAIKGEREIDEEQAAIIRRIFTEYALENVSPKKIAARLNAEHTPSPSGKGWTQSTINGNRRRGTGILNNALYIGQMIWNRQKFLKDPSTGKRVARLNPETEWIRQDVPELRIIPQDLWDAAKARQTVLDEIDGPLATRKRPQYLLSGLLECGVCSGGFAKVNTERYGCANARNKGASVCTNTKTITREKLEEAVLSALQTHLLQDELVEVFCAEYTRHKNELLKAQDKALNDARNELAKLAKERENIIDAIKAGVSGALVKDDLERVAARQEELKALLDRAPEEPRPLLHPAMAKRYREEVRALRTLLSQRNGNGEAKEIVRSLIEKIVLNPVKGKKDLSLDLYGDLAGILSVATQEKTMPQKYKRPGKTACNDNNSGPSVKLVAGAGFEPTTFGL